MKVLIFDSVYPQGRLGRHYDQAPSWSNEETNFGPNDVGNGPELADAFSALGHSCIRICVNDSVFNGSAAGRFFARQLPVLNRLPIFGGWLAIALGLSAKLRRHLDNLRPDLMYVLDTNYIPVDVLDYAKKLGCTVIGQISSPPPGIWVLRKYQRVFSAMTSLVVSLAEKGVVVEHLKLAFNPKYLGHSKEWPEREFSTVFVGSLGRHHAHTYDLLSAAKLVDPNLRIYAPNPDHGKLRDLGLDENYFGTAFGKEMYRVLGNSKIVLNRHALFAKGMAANLRLYEGTGVGAAVVTEASTELGEIFGDKEILTYSNLSELTKVIRWGLENDVSLSEVASAGQQKALAEHTILKRAQQILKSSGLENG